MVVVLEVVRRAGGACLWFVRVSALSCDPRVGHNNTLSILSRIITTIDDLPARHLNGTGYTETTFSKLNPLDLDELVGQRESKLVIRCENTITTIYRLCL